MTGGGDREPLRGTFDSVAATYHGARPDYPSELFDDLARHAALSDGGRLLEVGCATGKATLPLARRGFRISCLEPGPALAAEARRNLAAFDVELIEAYFEDWEPPAPSPYELVFAATAWHWVDPATRYERAWRALRPGGHLAFWSAEHHFPADFDPFFTQIQVVYDEVNQGLPPGTPWPPAPQLPDHTDEIAASGYFDVSFVRQYEWEVVYDADGYIALLSTFSGHIAMQPWQRERLFAEIRALLADRPDGRVRRHWAAVLHVARRRENRLV